MCLLLITSYDPNRSYISLNPSFAQITKNLFNLFLEILNLLLIFYYSDLRLLLAS